MGGLAQDGFAGKRFGKPLNPGRQIDRIPHKRIRAAFLPADDVGQVQNLDQTIAAAVFDKDGTIPFEWASAVSK